MRRITLDIWQHIPAGEQVESGYNYKLCAPEEAGTYTLYQLVDDKNCHQGWEWELDSDTHVGEDKRLITQKLFDLLKITRAGSDLTCCEYRHDQEFNEEFILLRWRDQGTRAICVTADSGTALIRDVLKAIE